MIVLLLMIAVTFVIVWFSQSLPFPIKVVCYAFLIVALIVLIAPLGPVGPIWR